MTVGERIKTFRKKKGLTQKQLAEKLGIIEETVRKYELGKLNPKKETLLRIAQALDVQLIDLDDSLGVLTEYDLTHDSSQIRQEVRAYELITSLYGENISKMFFEDFLSLDPEGQQKAAEYIELLLTKHKN